MIDLLAGGHVRTVHTNCTYPACAICNGFSCARCWLYEGSLTTECPGVNSYNEHAHQVYAGKEDFRGGKWVPGAVSIHSPEWLTVERSKRIFAGESVAKIDPDAQATLFQKGEKR